MTTYTTQDKGKKPYETPRMIIWGDVRQITKTSNQNAGKDGINTRT